MIFVLLYAVFAAYVIGRAHEAYANDRKVRAAREAIRRDDAAHDARRLEAWRAHAASTGDGAVCDLGEIRAMGHGG